MGLFNRKPATEMEDIPAACRHLAGAATRGDLGRMIAREILAYSPTDFQRMKRNFETRVQDLEPAYREELTRKINEHLLGTFQRIRLDDQQGLFKTLQQPVLPAHGKYWDMVEAQCRREDGGDAPRIRFLKYLLAGYCMLVVQEPGHATGTPFPGGGKVEYTGGLYYCPVRDKAGDVDSALCPYCPALQTPEIGYLRPATNPSERQKQEFIDNCYRYHNFNG